MKTIIFCLLFLLPMSAAQAQADSSFTYQGQLQYGESGFSGSADLEFALFDAPSGGNLVAGIISKDAHPVDNGLFQADLDFGYAAIGANPRFLEIRVNGQVLEPRQPIRPAPVALYALSGAGGGDASNWQLNGNMLFYLAGPVGIGTATPLATLHVEPGTSGEGILLPGIRVGQNTESPNVIGGFTGNVYNHLSQGSTIGGGGRSGNENVVQGDYATVGGGIGNTASTLATVSGGGSNHATANRATVAGGGENYAMGNNSTVSGGYGSGATGNSATVAGGADNAALGDFSMVAGGQGNQAAGNYSFAGGHQARALEGHHGSFVWSDSSGWPPFESGGPDQFLVQASGGVGFGRVPSDYFVIDSGLTHQDDDYGFGTAAMRVLLRDQQGAGITKFRILGNGGVAIGNSYNSSGVPADGLRTQGDVRVGGDLQVHGAVAIVDMASGNASSLCHTPWVQPNGETHNVIGGCGSSLRYKDSIDDLTAAMDIVKQLRPVTFRWKRTGRADLGLVAEEVAEIEPRLAEFDTDGTINGVNYRHLSALLVAALQEQHQNFQEQVAEQDAGIAALREQLLAQQRLIERQQNLLAARLAAVESMLSEDEPQSSFAAVDQSTDGDGP
jgi:hypothetical protein